MSWEMADKRTYVHWAEKKYDVVVFGMPHELPLRQRHGHQPDSDDAGALRPGHPPQAHHDATAACSSCSSICDGYFHDERWPYLRELYEMFQHDYMQTSCRT